METPKQPTPNKAPQKKSFSSYLFSTVLIFAILTALYTLVSGVDTKKPEVVALSEVARLVQAGEIKAISIEDQSLEITKTDDVKLTSKKEPSASLVETFAAYGVDQERISAVDILVKNKSGLAFFFLTVLPILLPIVIIVFFFYAYSPSERLWWHASIYLRAIKSSNH